MAASPALKLGLIGGNIAASKAPLLHALAGRQSGAVVTYDLLVPCDRGLDFSGVWAWARAEGYRGVNITYPHKEEAARLTQIGDPLVERIGAINTAIFDGAAVHGYNTDYSGFQAAYRAARGEQTPGVVAMIGAGGVGRAIAFGLMGLGASELRLYDRDGVRAAAVATALRTAGQNVRVAPNAAVAVAGADGLVNCSPVGMVGYLGTPLPADDMRGASWAFDAVYTPRDTQFLGDAAAAGLAVISGYELFFWQGVHAWKIFSGLPLDPGRLRQDLATAG
jgi:shikimate dehydrogenase